MNTVSQHHLLVVGTSASYSGIFISDLEMKGDDLLLKSILFPSDSPSSFVCVCVRVRVCGFTFRLLYPERAGGFVEKNLLSHNLILLC